MALAATSKLMFWMINCTIFILIIPNSNALYEDQIGKFDWKKEFVGVPNKVMFDSNLSVSKYIVMQTESNVMACLSAKNGQIVWRRIFGENDGVIVSSHVASGIVVAVTSTGIVHTWEINTGNLLWEENLAEDDNEFKELQMADISVVDLGYADGKTVLILSSDTFYMVKSPPDKDPIMKSFAVENKDGKLQMLFDSKAKEVTLFEFVVGYHIKTRVYSLENHEELNTAQVPASWMDDIKNVIVLKGGLVVYYSKDTDSFYAVDAMSGNELSSDLSVTIGIDSSVHSLRSIGTNDMSKLSKDFLVINYNNVAYSVSFNKDDNSWAVVSKFTLPQSSRISSAYVGNEKYYFVTETTDNNQIKISAFKSGSTSFQDDLTLTYSLPEWTGDIADIYVNLFMKKSSSVGFKVVLVSAGGTVLLMTQPSRIAWQREESLAEISSVVMLDLPLSDLNARIEVEFQEGSDNNIVEMFARRVEAQAEQLKTFAMQITKELKEGTLFQKKSKDPLIQDEDMIRDPFNLHKMLVVVTKTGKVLGLDSLTGKIVWQFFKRTLKHTDVKLFTQRTTAHFPHPPQAALVTTQQVITFNPITGKLLLQNEHAFKDLLHTVPLPFMDSKYLKPILCLDKDLQVYFHPQTEDVVTKFKNLPHPFFVYLATKNELSGYKITTELKAEKVWSVVFPENQYLTTLKGKMPNEKIDSIGRPLANRSVIYKYINPNAIAVVTESHEKNIDKAFITMYVIDAVTGHIIHSALHKKASSPVHIVNSENWLIYTYKSTKARRFEMMSVEFYEGNSLHNQTAFSSFHVRPEPIIMQQAYILPGRVNAIGVSVTEKGLTGRQLLFGLSRGSILGFPRRFFDPRRPLRQEPHHREEGLIQYSPEVPLPTEMLLNYNQTLQHISAIYSATSSLESTSIIFVTGLDLFFTRTQPSKMFDVLKEDFDYILITSVLIGMLVAVVITRKLSQNKMLNRAWK